MERWFAATFPGGPTEPQLDAWQAIAAGRDTLVAAPTGSGKTLAAFLWAIDDLVRSARGGVLEDETRVLYVSPLKALGNDVQRNLQRPLEQIQTLAFESAVHLADVRVAVRSGDTPAAERQAMVRRPPHVLITTPESLFILLTSDKGRQMLATVRTVIVDEIHAVAGDKRGAHLALSLERLDRLAGRPVQRIGLSATQKPIEEVARLLVGAGRVGSADPPAAPQAKAMAAPAPAYCALVDTGHRRAMELAIETPSLELGPIASHELWAEVYDRIVGHVGAHHTTIVFVNTRRLVERVAHALGERLGVDRVVAHHGSLSRRIRLEAERKLKVGEVPVVVATASLELGIDVGHVDLVCHLGAPRALATLLQRVGRSGHFLGSVPKGIFFPLTRDELLQTAAALRAIVAGELDALRPARAPLDILAQQIVAIAAAEDLPADELFALVRRAWPYRELERSAFDQLLEMLSDGVSTRRGRRGARVFHDRVGRRVVGRRGARLAAMTSGGAIPDTADYDVVEEPTEALIGKVNEDFAVESMAGDVFQLGNRSWRVRRIEATRVRVEDAGQTPPTMPFWFGESPGRTAELSAAVSDLRREVSKRLGDAPACVAWLERECGLDTAGAEQIVEYVRATVAMLGTVPTTDTIVAERFFDESGGTQLVLHAPFGAALNRAFGLSIRKRFCLSFDFELQAAATDDGIVLSLGEQHSFPLDSVFSMVRRSSFEHDLVQAALQSPMFVTRWRWNVTRSLTLLRHENGKRVPMNLQRMRAEDLLAAVFPAQVGCGDNRVGPIELPDHPLVGETMSNCLHEAMDADGLAALLERIEAGAIRCVAVETPAPSPMSHEILNANPYAFLDDAPLEERRARAVSLRRVDPDLASGIGALDAEAISEVCRQAWPDVRDADELHDALFDLVLLPVEDARTWEEHARNLVDSGRATLAKWQPPGSRADDPLRSALVAAERIAALRSLLPSATLAPDLTPPASAPACDEPEDAALLAVRGWLEHLGPVTAPRLADRLGLSERVVEAALLRLENDGVAIRGHFSAAAAAPAAPGTPPALDGTSNVPLEAASGRAGTRPQPKAAPIQWSDRRLLARIHRLTLGRLRREIEPVSPAEFVRFLLRWQHVAPATRLHGKDGVLAVLRQLQGIELPGPAWENGVLPARVADYRPEMLDDLCLEGRVVWGRYSPPNQAAAAAVPAILPARPRARRAAPSRNAPLALGPREDLAILLPSEPVDRHAGLSREAINVALFLESEGASFLADIVDGTGLLPSAAEEKLRELVACGLVTGDGFAGLRGLLAHRVGGRGPLRSEEPGDTASAASHIAVKLGRHGRAAPSRLRGLPAGRWSLIRRRGQAPTLEERTEALTRLWLRRYGVVVRELLTRETLMPPWRVLLGVLRRLEARGEVRGGRFVAGFVGEQFATPEAVEALRAARHRPATSDFAVAKDASVERCLLSAGDPLNLAGVILPGDRIPMASSRVLLVEDGVITDSGDLGAVRSRMHARLGEVATAAAGGATRGRRSSGVLVAAATATGGAA